MAGRFLLLGFGLAVGLLLAEVGARLAEQVGCQSYCTLTDAPDPYVGWRHVLGEEAWCQECFSGQLEWRTFTRINSAGLRDREIPYERRDEFRILVLGDSFTHGVEVAQDRTFPKLLEERLNTGRPPRRFEVINSGVGAWGTDNELLYFLVEGFRYQPDLVLLAFYTGNDVFENDHVLLHAAPYPFYNDKPYFVLEDGRLVLRHFPLPPEPVHRYVLRAIRRALRHHSALYWLRERLRLPRLGTAEAAAADPLPAPLQVYMERPTEPWREAWRITRGLLLRLRSEVERRGSRFAVVVINDRDEVCGRWRWLLDLDPAFRDLGLDLDRPNRLLTQFLRRRGIPVIPLLDDFRARFGQDCGPLFFRWNPHWAPAGHELAAEVIQRGLVDLGLLPPHGAGSEAVAPQDDPGGAETW